MENRLTDIQQVSQQSLNYGYDPWGRRVWKMATDRNTGAAECEVYFYGATGQKLEMDGCWSGKQTYAGTGIKTYFAGKMLPEKNVYVVTGYTGIGSGSITRWRSGRVGRATWESRVLESVALVAGDPVNYVDRTGRDPIGASCICDSNTNTCHVPTMISTIERVSWAAWQG